MTYRRLPRGGNGYATAAVSPPIARRRVRLRSLNGGCMALRLCDVQCDPIADRALKELTHRYIVAEEKARLVLTEKAGNMKLFLNDLDDLHQWDFSHHQEVVKENELLRQQRESWKVRALMAEAESLEATAKTSNNGGCQ